MVRYNVLSVRFVLLFILDMMIKHSIVEIDYSNVILEVRMELLNKRTRGYEAPKPEIFISP